MNVSVEPFNRLVKLMARAFYEDVTFKGDNMPKTRSDNRGIAVVVLDALTRRQWVREEDLAKDLRIHLKQLRRTLQFFQDEKLVSRYQRKETAKGAKIHNAAVATTANSHSYGRDGGDDKTKMHTQSYCCLDYAQIHDVVRYRLQRMRKKLKDQLESRNTIQEYICSKCSKRYNALDASRLISMEDFNFHCESCNAELVVECDKITPQDTTDGDDKDKRQRHEKFKELLQKLEVQLKPLVEQLNRVRDLEAPELRSLLAWEASVSIARRAANGDLNGNDNKSGQNGTPMPFLGETKVEVAISGVQADDENNKPGTSSEPMKVLPPWMIKQGMKLTKEQRGEMNEIKMESTSDLSKMSDDKKTDVGNDDARIQEEYYKSYYEALLRRQQEQQDAAVRKEEPLLNEQGSVSAPDDGLSSTRQVGEKSKREIDDEGVDDDFDWEDGATAAENIISDGTGFSGQASAAADPSNDNDVDDEVEWEDG